MFGFAWLKLVPTSVWVGLAAGVAFVLAVAWVDHRGYVRGQAYVQARWDAARAADAQALNEANERNRKLERDHDARVAAIGDDYAKQVADLEARRARDIANARAGALRLRVPNACPAAPGAGGVQAPAEGSHGATDGELSGAPVEDLASLAADADRNTAQLTACQQVINEYLHTQEKQQ